MHTSHASDEDLFSPLGEDILGERSRCYMMHTLKQYKEVHCIIRRKISSHKEEESEAKQ